MITTLKVHYITDLEDYVFIRHGERTYASRKQGTTIAVRENESRGAARLSATPSKSKEEATKLPRWSPMS
jgi:hypothetical protein